MNTNSSGTMFSMHKCRQFLCIYVLSQWVCIHPLWYVAASGRQSVLLSKPPARSFRSSRFVAIGQSISWRLPVCGKGVGKSWAHLAKSCIHLWFTLPCLMKTYVIFYFLTICSKVIVWRGPTDVLSFAEGLEVLRLAGQVNGSDVLLSTRYGIVACGLILFFVRGNGPMCFRFMSCCGWTLRIHHAG